MRVFLIFLAVTQALAASQAPPPGLEDLLAKVAVYDHGQSRAALVDLSELVSTSLGDPVRVRAIEKSMIRLLGSKATLAGKDAICRHLGVIGTDASVPVLAGLLNSDETADMARYALERMRGEAVDQALRRVLGSSNGKTRIGVINTIGQRGDARSVAVLAKLVWDSDQEAALAAVTALGKISGPEAANALAQARAKAQGALRTQALQSSLACADRLAERGNAAAALPAYKELSAPSQPAMIRIGALGGLARASGAGALPALLEGARGEDTKVRAASIALIAAIPGPEPAKALLAELPKLPAPARVQVLHALGDRGESSSREAMLAAVASPEEPMRIAGLTGLGRVGNASDVKVLTARAAEGQGAEQAAARESLYGLRVSGVDGVIVASIFDSSSGAKAELVRACGARLIAACADTLVSAVRREEQNVRREALRALAETAGKEHISALVDLVEKLQDADRREAGRSLAAAMRRTGASVSELSVRYFASTEPDLRSALLGVAGQLGSDDLLPALRAGLAEKDPDVRRAAILAATEWPAPTPLDDLMQMAEKDSSPSHRVLALRGALRLIPITSNRTPAENAVLLTQAWRLATQVNEKRGVLALLPRFPSKETLDLASAAADDPAVEKEAKTAVQSIRKSMGVSR